MFNFILILVLLCRGGVILGTNLENPGNFAFWLLVILIVNLMYYISYYIIVKVHIVFKLAPAASIHFPDWGGGGGGGEVTTMLTFSAPQK